jgi:hypothetical protein
VTGTHTCPNCRYTDYCDAKTRQTREVHCNDFVVRRFFTATATIPNVKIIDDGEEYVTRRELNEHVELLASLTDDVDLLRAATLGEAEATKKALDALTTREEDLERRVWDADKKLEQMDHDHVALLKCYTQHLREHMPAALRDAGEAPAPTVAKAELDEVMKEHEQEKQHWSQDVLLGLVAKVANGAIEEHVTEYHADVAAWRKARAEGMIRWGVHQEPGVCGSKR